MPQGSVLGPLLFLLFINDLVRHLENPMYMFADDLKILGCPTHDSLQRDLDRLYDWTVLWDLPMDADKYRLLVTDVGRDSSRTIGTHETRTVLQMTSVVHDLGVQISGDFKPCT